MRGEQKDQAEFVQMNPIGMSAAVNIAPAPEQRSAWQLPSNWKSAGDITFRFLVTYGVAAKCWYIVLFVAIHPIGYDQAINRTVYWGAFWCFFGGALLHWVAKKNGWKKFWKRKKVEKYDGQEWIECMSIFSSMSSIFALLMKMVTLFTTEKAGDISYYTPWVCGALTASFLMSVVLRIFVSRSVDLLVATTDWYQYQSNPPYIETLLASQRKLNDFNSTLNAKQLNRKRVSSTIQHALAVAAVGGLLNELLAVPIKSVGNSTAHLIFYFGPLFAAIYGGLNHYFFKNNGCGRVCKTPGKKGHPIAPGATVLRVCDSIVVFTIVGLGLVMLYMSVPQLYDQSRTRVSDTVAQGALPLPIWAIGCASLIGLLVARQASLLAYEIVKEGRVRRTRGASIELRNVATRVIHMRQGVNAMSSVSAATAPSNSR